MFNSIVANNTGTPIFSSGSSTTFLAGSLLVYGSGNIGIGTTGSGTTSSGSPISGSTTGTVYPRMTINSNGSVGLFNTFPNTHLNVHSEDLQNLKIKLFDLILGSSLKYKISGEFATEIFDLFQNCECYSITDGVCIYEKLRDILREKIPRFAECEFYDIMRSRMDYGLNTDLIKDLTIFEGI